MVLFDSFNTKMKNPVNLLRKASIVKLFSRGILGQLMKETVPDIDGNIYRMVKIAGQVWLAENLKVTRYRNGDAIPNITDNGEWEKLTSGAYCNYENEPGNGEIYGRLYNWHAVNEDCNIAPEGWHVPTDDEWKQLEMNLGMSSAEANRLGWRGEIYGGKLKETGKAHWKSHNRGASNSSGFTAIPGGYRLDGGTFSGLGGLADFWSATENGTDKALIRSLDSRDPDIRRDSDSKKVGFSVRLIRD